MAADSIRKLALQKIKTTLETITVANGYHNTVKSVERASQNPLETGVYPAVAIFETAEEKGMGLARGAASGVPSPLGRMGANLLVELHFILETTLASASDDCDNMLTDLERALFTIDEVVLSNGALLEFNVTGSEVVIAGATLPLAGGRLDVQMNYAYQRGRPDLP